MSGLASPGAAPAVVAEAVAEARAEGAEDAAAAAAAQVAAVVEAAAERVERAEDTAQAMADAALQTEIGRRVAALEARGDGLWSERLSTAIETISAALTQMAALQGQLIDLLTAEPPPAQSTPASSTSVDPGANPAPAEAPEGPAKKAGSARRNLI